MPDVSVNPESLITGPPQAFPGAPVDVTHDPLRDGALPPAPAVDDDDDDDDDDEDSDDDSGDDDEGS